MQSTYLGRCAPFTAAVLALGLVAHAQAQPAKRSPGKGVEVRRNGANVDFFIDGKQITRYDTTTGPNKPYFYPLNTRDGRRVLRHWPVEPDAVPGETHDHPHHRGLWFTHGAVNGIDFWSQEKGAGRTVHTGYERIESGPDYGRMIARTDWLTPDGRKIAEDRRDIRLYPVRNGYLLDFEIAVKAVGRPLVWGDTKEGMFGLRLADSMRVNPGRGQKGDGHIVNAAGDRDGATWGKAAAWCDYYGPVDGRIVGVAILDHPSNLRHPTTWHVRDYGLFAANPFGLHDFDPARKNDPKAGEYTTPEGQTTTFRYRVFVHDGDTETADVPAAWNAYAASRAGKAGRLRTQLDLVLFDGRTLAGWERKAVHGGNGGIWEVKDGAIVGDQEPDHKGGLLGTTRIYSDYEIELEFKADEPLDSGLFLRTTPTGDAYQVTIDIRPDGSVGSIYVPSKGFIAQDPDWRKKYRPNDWNRLRARITGQPARVQVWLNGQQTVDFQDTEARLPRVGYIGLQVHGGGGAWGKDSRIRYRSIRLRPITSSTTK